MDKEGRSEREGGGVCVAPCWPLWNCCFDSFAGCGKHVFGEQTLNRGGGRGQAHCMWHVTCVVFACVCVAPAVTALNSGLALS